MGQSVDPLVHTIFSICTSCLSQSVEISSGKRIATTTKSYRFPKQFLARKTEILELQSGKRCCSSHLYSLCPKDMQLLHIIPSSSCLEVPWKMAVFVPRCIYNLLQPRRSELPRGLQLKYFVSLNDIFCLVQSRFTPKFKTTALSRLFNVIFALIPID